MKNKKSTQIIVGIVMIIIGVVLFAIGIFSVSNYLKKKKTYVKIIGVVVDYDIKGTAFDDDIYDDNFHEDLEYAPIVEYEVDGKVYEKIHNVHASVPEYFIGQKVTLYYNPQNPEDAIFKYNNAFWIPLLVGTIFVGCGLPMTFVGIFKKKKI